MAGSRGVIGDTSAARACGTMKIRSLGLNGGGSTLLLTLRQRDEAIGWISGDQRANPLINTPRVKKPVPWTAARPYYCAGCCDLVIS